MAKLSVLINRIVIVIVSFIMIIMGGTTSILRYKNGQEEHLHNVNLLVKRLCFNLDWPLWDYNTDSIENIMQLEIENDFVTMIALYNEDNRLIFGITKNKNNISANEAEKIIFSTNPKLISNNKVLHYEFDKKGIEIGNVVIVTTKSYLFTNLSKDICLTLVQFILMAIVLITILHEILKKVIVVPLQKYCELVGSFREHNLFIRANFNQNHEMKVLSDSFNAMAETLQNYSEEMKSQVKLRTHQLQVYNDELLNIQRQIESEMQMGQRIQEAIIPKTKFAEIDCAGFYRPMEQLGGDYYDIVNQGNGKYAFVIADVCGHGIPAAMVTMMAKISFQKNIRLYSTPEDVIRQVNLDLCKITANKEYLAAFYGELDLTANILTYSNAALTEILLIQKDGTLQRLLPNSSIIGYVEKLPLQTATISTENTSKLVLYTDGITESTKNGERYGIERLESVVLRNKDKKAEELKNAIIEDLNSFMPLESAKDDLTLLVINLDNSSI